jgi:hypothetical protein
MTPQHNESGIGIGNLAFQESHFVHSEARGACPDGAAIEMRVGIQFWS